MINIADMVSRELSAYVLRQRDSDAGSAQLQVKSPDRTHKERPSVSLKLETYRDPAKTYFGKVPQEIINRYPRLVFAKSVS